MKSNTKPRDGYTIVPNSFFNLPSQLTPQARILWLAILSLENDGWAWPSQDTLGEMVGCSRRHVARLVNELIKAKSLERKPGVKGRSTRYRTCTSHKNVQSTRKELQCDTQVTPPVIPEAVAGAPITEQVDAQVTPVNNSGCDTQVPEIGHTGHTTSTITSTNKTSTTQRPPKVSTPEEREVRSEAVERRTTDYYLRGYKRGIESIPAMWSDLHWKSQGRDHYPLTPVEKKGVRQIWDWYWAETAGEVEQTMRNVFTCMARGWHCHEINRYPFTEGEVPTLSRVAQQLKMLEEVDHKALTKPRKTPQEREAQARAIKAKHDARLAKERAWRDEQEQNINAMVKKWKST